jgi:methylthioribose-1-phosphate isomerase
VNLFWAIERMKRVLARAAHDGASAAEISAALDAEALRIHDEDVRSCREIGAHGAALVPAQARILTHCNAGALATAGYGTALGVVRAAVERGHAIEVYADETRPFLQGARLTAWELVREGIKTTVITDNMAGVIMREGIIDLVVVGADRIAANGDVANKVGTYTVAVLAREHGIPFYVAAPWSTVDLSTPDGTRIPIEERAAREVTHVGAVQLAPDGVSVRNPAFDVTPATYIAAIITDRGIARPPYEESLRALSGRADVARGDDTREAAAGVSPAPPREVSPTS